MPHRQCARVTARVTTTPSQMLVTHDSSRELDMVYYTLLTWQRNGGATMRIIKTTYVVEICSESVVRGNIDG